MKTLGLFLACTLVATSVVVGCSDDDTTNPVTPEVDSGSSGSSGSSGGGDASTPTDSSTPADAATDAPASCTAAKETLLKPIDKTSTGVVTTLATTATSKTIFVDASAGGSMAAATNPRIYINLETLSRVEVTDKTAASSTAWDLALKRPILFANNGDGGPGAGSTAFLEGTAFDTVNAASATTATFEKESFFQADCTPKVDETGAVQTSFDGWYDYDLATNIVTPAAGTWLVKGGTGQLYKVEILQYYANEDGTPGMAGGRYTLTVAPL